MKKTILALFVLTMIAGQVWGSVADVTFSGTSVYNGMTIIYGESDSDGFTVETTAATFTYATATGDVTIAQKFPSARTIAVCSISTGDELTIESSTTDSVLMSGTNLGVGIYADSTMVVAARTGSHDFTCTGAFDADYEGRLGTEGEIIQLDDNGGIGIYPKRDTDLSYTIDSIDQTGADWDIELTLEDGMQVMVSVAPPRKFRPTQYNDLRIVHTSGCVDSETDLSLGTLPDNTTIGTWNSNGATVIAIQGKGFQPGLNSFTTYVYGSEGEGDFSWGGDWLPMSSTEFNRVLTTAHGLDMYVLPYTSVFYHYAYPGSGTSQYMTDVDALLSAYDVDGIYIDTLPIDHGGTGVVCDKIDNWEIMRQVREKLGTKILYYHGSSDHTETASVPNIDALCDIVLYGEDVVIADTADDYPRYQIVKENISNTIGMSKATSVVYTDDQLMTWLLGFNGSGRLTKYASSCTWSTSVPSDISSLYTALDLLDPTVYYVDNLISDCADYNPTTFSCGAGSYQGYDSMDDIETNVSAGLYEVYFRKGQTHTGTGDFEPKSDIIYGAFGTGADPILSLTVTAGIDFRNDDSGATFNNLDIRTTTGDVFRVYGTGSTVLNINDCALSGPSGLVVAPSAAYNVRLNIDGLSVDTTGNPLYWTNANAIIGGSISDSTFESDTEHTMSVSGKIRDLTISDSTFGANSALAKYGMFFSGITDRLYLNGNTVNSSGYHGVMFLASASAMSNIFIDDGTYNNNGQADEYSGIRFEQSATGSIDGVTITKATVSGNSLDGISTSGTVTNLLIGGSYADRCFITNNGTDGVGADGDGIALHGATSGEVSYNKIIGNLKTQAHAIDTSDVTFKFNIMDGANTAASFLAYESASVDLYNNTMVNDTPTVPVVSITADGSGGTFNIKNNIITGGTYSVSSLGTPTLNLDYNDYYGYATGAINGGSDGGNSLNVDPRLNMFYAPPALISGTDVSITTDYYGRTPTEPWIGAVGGPLTGLGFTLQ